MIESGSSNLYKLLTERVSDETPDGWKTTEQWADELNKSDSVVHKHLREGIKAGIVECKRFPKRSVDGIMRPQPFYRFVPKKGK